MLKREPQRTEHSPRATSSKNAKNKSNSTTLLAMRNNKEADDSSGRGSCCSSEKDSGYSDNGSDWQHADMEDQRSNTSQSGECADISHSSQSLDPGQGNSGSPSVMPEDLVLLPVCIINDMGFKQQPSLMTSTLQAHKPLPQKKNDTGKKISHNYLPILNSYPRIAPHPSKKPLDKSSVVNEPHNLTKRVCTECKSNLKPLTRSLLEQQIYKQTKSAVSTSGQPGSSSAIENPTSSSSTAATSSQTTPSVSSQDTTSSFLTTRGLRPNSTSSTRHRRFFNTAEILRHSGLLNITLHTKELLHQNNATEREIAELRLHTELLCQVACNPSHSLNSITAWRNLHRAMAESGSYPNLETLQNLQHLSHADTASQAENISTGDGDRSLSPENSNPQLSCLLTSILDPIQNCSLPQKPHTQQCRELQASEKAPENVSFMPPDSSTV